MINTNIKLNKAGKNPYPANIIPYYILILLPAEDPNYPFKIKSDLINISYGVWISSWLLSLLSGSWWNILACVSILVNIFQIIFCI